MHFLITIAATCALLFTYLFALVIVANEKHQLQGYADSKKIVRRESAVPQKAPPTVFVVAAYRLISGSQILALLRIELRGRRTSYQLSPAAGNHLQLCVIDDVIVAPTNRRNVPTANCLSPCPSRLQHRTSVRWHASELQQLGGVPFPTFLQPPTPSPPPVNGQPVHLISTPHAFDVYLSTMRSNCSKRNCRTVKKKQYKLDGQGKAQREAARRRNSKCENQIKLSKFLSWQWQ